MSPSISHHDVRGVPGVPAREGVDRLRLVGEALAASATSGVQLLECARELRRMAAAGTSTAELRDQLRRYGVPVVTIATVPTPTGTECRRIVRRLGGWSL